MSIPRPVTLEEAEVEQFCEDLQDLLELTAKKNVFVIIGDWNAKVGNKDSSWLCVNSLIPRCFSKTISGGCLTSQLPQGEMSLEGNKRLTEILKRNNCGVMCTDGALKTLTQCQGSRKLCATASLCKPRKFVRRP